MKFEEALTLTGRLVQVWATNLVDGKRLVAIYSLAEDGAKQLALQDVASHDVENKIRELRGRGLEVAQTHEHCQFVWAESASRIEVYGNRCKMLDGDADLLNIANGAQFKRSDIAKIFTYCDDDLVCRGVNAELHSGEEVALLMEVVLSAEYPEVYGRFEAMMDITWTPVLGRALAAWAGAVFEDRVEL